MDSRKFSIILLLLIIVLGETTAQIAQLKIGDRINMTEIKGMNQEVYSLDSLDGKLLIMNFWNNGCRGCEMERPYLNKLHEDYKDKEIAFWSITMNAGEHLEIFLEGHPINWQILGGIDFMGLEGDKTFEIKCMPTTIIINEKKEIKYFKCGPIMDGDSGEKFRKLINRELKN